MSANAVTPGLAAMKLAIDDTPASEYADSEAGGVSLELSDLIDDGEDVLLIPAGRLAAQSEKAASIKSNGSGSQAAGIKSNGLASQTAAKTGSPGGKAAAPVQRYTPPFVRNGQRCVDDPFQSPKATPSSSKKGRGRKGSNALSLNNWRSSSGSSHASNSSVGSLLKGKGKQPAGAIRIGHFVGGSYGREFSALAQVPIRDTGAQESSSCSVFVANLLKTTTDERLAEAIARVFGEFGAVDVKVRRDTREMPYAFVQYASEQDADRAIQFGHGRMIMGRACRCEKAKANRTYLVESRDGAAVVPEIVRSIMSGYGQVDSCKGTTPALCREHGINEGVIVRFRTYDAGQAACMGMRQHDKLKMRAAPTLQLPAIPLQPPPVNMHAPSVDEVDRHSIFVGNIQRTTTEAEVAKLFIEFGRIENIELHECESKYIPGTQYFFAFVEYKYESSVIPAVHEMHFYEYFGQALKVQQKRSRPNDNIHVRQNIRTPPHVPGTCRPAAPRIQQQAQPVQQIQQFPQQAPMAYYTPPHLPNSIFNQAPYGWSWSMDYGCWVPSPPPTYYNPYAPIAAAQQAPPVYYGQAAPGFYPTAPTFVQQPQLQNFYTPPAGSLATTNDRATTPTPTGQTGTGADALEGATL